MKFFVDTWDIEAVRRVNEFFPIEGFTTNPNILTRSPRPVEALMPEYRAYVRETGQTLFVQVTAQNAEGMFDQAERLRDYFGNGLVVKLPATREGYKACLACKARNMRVCVTVVHSAMQGVMAAEAGADYVAPYITHIDNIGADGAQCVDEMVKAFAKAGQSCQVLGASFRTVKQLEQLVLVGCHAVTITPEMFDVLIAHASTDDSLRMFEAAWKNAFGERQITDFLPR